MAKNELLTEDQLGAKDAIAFFTFVGILLAAFGGFLAVVAWPGTLSLEEGGTESGNGYVAAGGIILAAVGQLLATIGLVGYAVSLGVRRAGR